MDDAYFMTYMISAVVGGLIFGAICIAIIRSKGYEAAPFSGWFWCGFFLCLLWFIVVGKPKFDKNGIVEKNFGNIF